MAHGSVVCAFNNSSIPEIGGDAILIAGNNDFVQWGKQINSLIHDPAAYRLLSRKAIERAALFSEDRMFERYKTYFMTTVTKN
jgi:glycosyltransferase involved in cell wall biosynthesis